VIHEAFGFHVGGDGDAGFGGGHAGVFAGDFEEAAVGAYDGYDRKVVA